MLLKTLKLYNFRQFKGEHVITFSTDKDKNVTVILGKNTSGKTTLIQSFYWVLYGKTNFQTKDFLLNLEVANSLNPGEIGTVKVELELIHDFIEYAIIKEQDYFCYSKGNITPKQARLKIQYKTLDGQTQYIDEKELTNTINKILPEDLSSYFFFDGERIGDLGKNDKKGKKDLADAVKGVLGLNVISNAIIHLSRGQKTSVIGMLKNSIDSEGNEKLKNYKKVCNQNRQRIEKIEKEIEDYKKTIDYYEGEIEKLNDIIINNKPTTNMKKKIISNEAEINLFNKKLELKTKKIRDEFSRKAPMFFSQPLLNKALNILNETEYIDEGIPEMHSKSIDFLIQRGRCICGAKIEENNEAYKNLLEAKEYLPPKSIGTLVRIFINDAKHYQNDADDFYDTIIDLYKEYRSIKNGISELISENEKISKEIQGKPDVGNIEVQIKSYRSKLKQFQNNKENLIGQRAIIENSIVKLDNDIKELAFTSEKNKIILECLDYAEYVNKRLSIHYSAMEKVIKNKLEDKVNEIFSQMYHGNRKVVIDDNYEYSLIITEGNGAIQADESKGLETVTSFAFISGIIELAKEKIVKDDIEIKSEPYPLVMDAPFSNADEYHVKSISKLLPNTAEQVIMFIMHKDWKYAEDVLNPKLERMYELVKKSETNTVIRGVSNV